MAPTLEMRKNKVQRAEVIAMFTEPVQLRLIVPSA